MRTRSLFIIIGLIAPAMIIGQDVSPLVRASVEHELEGDRDGHDYTYRYTEIERTLTRDAIVKSTRTRTYEAVFLYGKQFIRLVGEEGYTKASEDIAQENRKYEKTVAARARMTEAERQAEDSRELQNRAQRREFIRQIPDLYTFQLLREEELRGRSSWVIGAAPRREAHPRGFMAANLSHLCATIWIDKADGRWAKVEAAAPREIKFGLFLARIHEGSRIVFEQAKINNDIWLPSRIAGMFSARLGFAQVNLQSETTYFDYRRFKTESKIVNTGAAQ